MEKETEKEWDENCDKKEQEISKCENKKFRMGRRTESDEKRLTDAYVKVLSHFMVVYELKFMESDAISHSKSQAHYQTSERA